MCPEGSLDPHPVFFKEDHTCPASPPRPRPRRTSTPTTSHVPHEKIAQRAYEKWMKRGCTHGCHLQDWTEAEAELKAETGGASKQATPPKP